MSTLTRRISLIAALATVALALMAFVPAAKPKGAAVSPPVPLDLPSWQGKAYGLGDEVRAVIPEADFLTHEYRNSEGMLLDFAILTTPSPNELHDPSFCFQSQGWTIASTAAKTMTLGGKERTVGWCRIESGETGAESLYAFVTPSIVSTGDWRFHFEALRQAFLGRPTGPARFIRILWYDDSADLAAAQSLLQETWPYLGVDG